MQNLMNKVESGITAVLWSGAAILLPLAALTPGDGDRAIAATSIASASCLSIALDTLRACPATAL
jgi:hypothetical protein